MVMSLVDDAHGLLAIVQRNVVVVPNAKPVIIVVAEVGFAMVAVPETTDQVPVPIVGVFPVTVVLVVQAVKV